MIAVILAVAVFFGALAAVGVLALPGTWPRLHALGLTTACTWLVALAVWLGPPGSEARIKSTLIAVVATFANAGLAHAIARAERLRQERR